MIIYWSFVLVSSAVLLLQNIVMTSPVGELPEMSNAVKDEAFTLGGSSVVNLWEHGLRLQRKERTRESTVAKPGTVVASYSMKMVNLVPQDSGHPLYSSEPNHTRMRHNFLLDSMIQEKVNPANPKMKEEAGLSVTNMNGREFVFKRKADGKLYINDMLVKEEKELSDGTQLFVVDDVIFSYAADVREAWKAMN